MVLIEGMDLAGKTETTKRVVAELRRRGRSVVHRRNFLTERNLVGALADEHRRDGGENARVGAYYVGAYITDLVAFERPRDTLHLQESCWLRGIALHSVMSGSALPAIWHAIAHFGPRFDAAVFLTASIDARRARYAWRAANDALDRLAFDDAATFRAIDERLLRLVREQSEHMIDIDTDTADPATTAMHVVDLCDRLTIEKGQLR